ITGAVAFDIDWDGDKDLIFTRSNGTNTLIQNNSTILHGNTIHLRIVDENGINALLGNTVQLYDSSGNWVASQIINPQSGNQTSDTSALVDFHGLNANETYSAVLLRNIGGVSQDVGGIASAGSNVVENVNAAWGGLKAGAATSAYVLTAESGTNNADTIGPGIVGTGYNDTLFATLGNDVYNGAGGWADGIWSNTGGQDIIDFKLAGTTAVTVDLGNTGAQATGFNTVTLLNIEGVAGGQGNDTLSGNSGDNLFEGRGGDDTIHLGSGGKDTVLFRLLDNLDATGGNGTDTISGFTVGVYKATPDADRIDLRELLSGYTADADGAARYIDGIATLDAGETIGDFLRVSVSGADTIISVDRDGAGGEHNFTDIAVLTNVNTNLETLLANHQLVAA
ncbi:MAG: type I secretion C-terminal target domain-containing protein, partial [Micavibrio sp.]